jgi:hypothetical protein
VLELAVAATRRDEPPTVLLQHPQDLAALDQDIRADFAGGAA